MLKAFASTAFVRMLGIGLAFLQSIVLARVFGADVFGVFSFAVAIISFADIILTLGLDQFLMREIAQRGESLAINSPRFRTLRWLIVKLVFPLVCVATAVGLLLLWTLDSTSSYRIPVFAVLATFSLLVCRKLAEAVALGLKQQLRSILSSKIVFPAIMILGALIIAVTGTARSEIAISVLYTTALGFSAIVAIWFIRQSHVLRPQNAPSADKAPTKDVLVPALNLAFVMSANIIMNNMDTVLIAPIASPQEAAYARVGQRLAEATVMIQIITMLHFKPLIAEAYGNADNTALKAQLKVIARVLGGLGTLAFLAVMLFATPLALIFGEDFRATDSIIRAYAIGAYVMILAGPGMLLLTMTSKEAVASRIMWSALAINLALDLALIPFLGGLGAGIATSASQIVLALGLLRACRRNLGLDASILSQIFAKPSS